MDNIFKHLAIDVRESIDAEQIVYELLQREYPNEDWTSVAVYSEIDLDLNAVAENGRVILYEVSPGQQVDRGLWRFTVSFTVLAADTNNPSGLARNLYRTDLPQRRSDAKENQGKNIKEYGFDASMDARDLI